MRPTPFGAWIPAFYPKPSAKRAGCKNTKRLQFIQRNGWQPLDLHRPKPPTAPPPSPAAYNITTQPAFSIA